MHESLQRGAVLLQAVLCQSAALRHVSAPAAQAQGPHPGMLLLESVCSRARERRGVVLGSLRCPSAEGLAEVLHFKAPHALKKPKLRMLPSICWWDVGRSEVRHGMGKWNVAGKVSQHCSVVQNRNFLGVELCAGSAVGAECSCREGLTEREIKAAELPTH